MQRPLSTFIFGSTVNGYGAAPGGHAQTDWYFKGPLGVSLSANVAWYGGSSFVLRGNAAVMVTAGPILRLEIK